MEKMKFFNGLKILQVAPPWVNTPPRDHGGTEWVIANLIKGLSSLGHNVALFATKNSRGSKLHYIFEKPLLELDIPWNAALPALIHYHEAFKIAKAYDFVHAHLSSETDLVILPFLADLTEQGIPNLVTIHSHWPFDNYSRMDEMFLNLYAGRILAVNISSFMQNSLPNQFRNGGFVYNSLDLTKMKFSSRSGNYLTWLGKILPEKGIAEAIRIARQTNERLIFAGIIDKYRAGAFEYWEKEVKPLIDGHQIKYLGPADLELKNKMLGGAKAFLNLIQWEEPFGMVLIESMACGTPVISYKKGATPEVIKDRETGFLVNTRAEAIEAITKVQSIDRQACRQHVEEQFSPEAAALNYLNLYFKEIKTHRQFAKSKQLIYGKFSAN